MSGWVAGAIAVGTIGGAYISSKGASKAADASTAAAQTQAGSEREQLAYLKERERIPRQFSEQGLKGLGGLYGMEGGTGSQQQLINQALKSPLYGALMGGQEAGEDAILRSASATGGLRSGNVQSNLYDYNVQLQNQALLQSYNQQLQGLQGMAGLPSNANQIGQTIGGIGKTLGQGQVAAGQAIQQGYQGIGNSLLSGAGMAVDYYSDRRLKKNLKKVSEIKGHNWYTWDWNIVAQKMGLKGKSEGVLADEIVVTDPDCIKMKYGFLMVNYTKLGIFKGVANA